MRDADFTQLDEDMKRFGLAFLWRVVHPGIEMSRLGDSVPMTLNETVLEALSCSTPIR